MATQYAMIATVNKRREFTFHGRWPLAYLPRSGERVHFALGNGERGATALKAGWYRVEEVLWKPSFHPDPEDERNSSIASLYCFVVLVQA